MATEIKVPTLGESVTEATVARWLKKIGETVAMDEPLVELETDKVTLEVNAPAAGVLSEIVAQEGASLEVGGLLGRIDTAGAKPAAAAPAKAPEPAPASPPPPACCPRSWPMKAPIWASALCSAGSTPLAPSLLPQHPPRRLSRHRLRPRRRPLHRLRPRATSTAPARPPRSSSPKAASIRRRSPRPARMAA